MHLSRLFQVVLLGFAIAACATMAHAQIYVASAADGSISEYNASTGALIKESLVTGLGRACAIVYDHGALYVINPARRVVEKYDAQTGFDINREFVTGLNEPMAITVSGSDLYVASFADMFVGRLSIVSKYNAQTGAVISYKLLSYPGYISGLAVHDNHLFIAPGYGSSIGEYDATSGRLLSQGPFSNQAKFAVLTQDGNYLWMNHGNGVLTKHDLDSGRDVLALQAPLVSGLTDTRALAVSGDDLFVANGITSSIAKYNASTGSVINASFITGLDSPVCLAVVPGLVESNSGPVGIPASVANGLGVCVLALVIALAVRGLMHVGGAKGRSLRAAAFPNGMRKVTILSFSGEPVAGCLLMADSVQAQLAGLQIGDLIVALDGVQVEDEEQYALVDAFGADSRMSWIVWREHRYHAISAWVPERKLEARLQTRTASTAEAVS